MRILLSVHRYPPHIGGSEEVSRRIAEHLAGEGHDVTVATSHHGRRAPAENPDVRQFLLSSSNLWPDLPPPERAEAARYRTLFEEPWDIRFIYAAQSWALNAVWDLIGSGRARDILAPCGYSWLGEPEARSYFALIEQLLPKFAHVVYHSDSYQDYVFARDRGLIDNAVVIPNGTDLPSLPFSVEEKHAAGSGATLVTIGSHVRTKGHADFFRACRRTGLPGILVAARPASRRERVRGCYFQCRARVAVSPNVDLVDGRSRPLVERALSDAHLFFFPSAIETAPLVILEAMARATPWVSYDVGMVRTLPGGLVVRDVGEAVETLAALAGDAARRRDLAEAGRRAVADVYEWSRVLPEYARLVQSLP
jgi:glycosyltransferase involved in cell wall biosynthesis